MCMLLLAAWIVIYFVRLVGIDGGFDNGEPEYEEAYSIVILPGYISLPFPSVELPEKVLLDSPSFSAFSCSDFTSLLLRKSLW